MRDSNGCGPGRRFRKTLNGYSLHLYCCDKTTVAAPYSVERLRWRRNANAQIDPSDAQLFSGRQAEGRQPVALRRDEDEWTKSRQGTRSAKAHPLDQPRVHAGSLLEAVDDCALRLCCVES